LSALFLLAGCGGNNATGPFYGAASGTMTQDIATALSSSLDSVAALNPTNPTTALSTTPGTNPGSYSRGLFADCITSTPASPVDADGDNTKATLKETFACT